MSVMCFMLTGNVLMRLDSGYYLLIGHTQPGPAKCATKPICPDSLELINRQVNTFLHFPRFFFKNHRLCHIDSNCPDYMISLLKVPRIMALIFDTNKRDHQTKIKNLNILTFFGGLMSGHAPQIFLSGDDGAGETYDTMTLWITEMT